jgi:hypothetical protein
MVDEDDEATSNWNMANPDLENNHPSQVFHVPSLSLSFFFIFFAVFICVFLQTMN